MHILVLLTACNSGSDSEMLDENPIPVNFSINRQQSFTRSTSSIVSFTSGEKVKVCVSNNGGSNYTGYDYTVSSTSQTPELTPPSSGNIPYFPVGVGTTVQAYAYYPSTAGESSTFSVQSNQTGNDEYKASDLMYSANQTITKPSSGSLIMEHKMAQLVITANAVTGSGLTVRRVIVNARNCVTFTPSTGVTVTQATKSDIIALNTSGTGYVLIPVQQISDVIVKIETGDEDDVANTATYSFSSTDDFEAGNSYPLNLTVTAEQLGANTVIADWNERFALIVTTQNRILRNPLWYVAPYNIAANSLTMGATDNAGYYFSWTDAMTKFAAQGSSYNEYQNGNRTIANTETGSKWHLPVTGEWRSIVPCSYPSNMWSYVSSSSTSAYKSAYNTSVFGYNDETKAGISESAYFRYASGTEIHAIRFLGTIYCSAWKYELLGGWSSSNYGYLRISATMIDNVADSEAAASAWYAANWNSITFGNNEAAYAVQRVFYARGYNSGGTNANGNMDLGSIGRYWATESSGGNTAYYLHFASGTLRVSSGGVNSDARMVRLFRDN